MSFAERLRDRRTELGLTQRGLAEVAGVSSSAVSSYEKYDKIPPLDIAAKIAKALGVTLEWLSGDDSPVFQVKTVGDVARVLMHIDAQVYSKCYFSHTFTDDLSGNPEDAAMIIVRNYYLSLFCENYDRMRKNLAEGVIDQELFDLWVNKELKRLDNERLDLPF